MPTSPLFDLRIDNLKITKYLLNLDHPGGAAKARYFISYGFHPQRPHELAEALFHHARTEALVSTATTRFGTIFVFEGPLRKCPNAKITSNVISVWELSAGLSIAKLVTAYKR